MKKTSWPGNWKFACHRCGFWYPSSEIKKEWTGVMACRSCFETKHPQLTIRVREETAVPSYVSKDVDPSTFINVCDINTSSCYADMCTADCAQADNTRFSYAYLIDSLKNGHGGG